MKRLLNIGVKLVVSLGLIAYLVSGMNWQDLGAIFARIAPEYFALAAFFFLVSNTLGSVQWYLLLRAQNLPIRFGQALIFYFVGVFFNNVLLGNIGGDAMRIYDIRRLTGESSGGVAATMMDRFIGLFSTCGLALAAYPLIIGTTGKSSLLVSVLVPVWLGLIVVLAMGLSRRIGGLVESLLIRFLPQVVGEMIGKLRRSVVVYRERVPLLAGIWCISLGVQFCRILVYWSAGMAIGMTPGLLYFMCFQPIAAVIASLPISIGGLGVRENTLVGLFGGLGFAPEVSTAMSLLGYLAGILASLFGGIAFVLRRVEKESGDNP
ncbi:MAG: lysylphosphatidylglycerol synthase transmembrane domain-containing protein [Candidatus Latescibacterota bacterium]